MNLFMITGAAQGFRQLTSLGILAPRLPGSGVAADAGYLLYKVLGATRALLPWKS